MIFSLLSLCSAPVSQRCNPQSGAGVEWRTGHKPMLSDKNYPTFLQQSDTEFVDVRDNNPASKISTGILPAHTDLASYEQQNKENPTSQVSCIYWVWMWLIC